MAQQSYAELIKLNRIVFYHFVYTHKNYIYTECPILIASGKYIEKYERYEKHLR